MYNVKEKLMYYKTKPHYFNILIKVEIKYDNKV